MKHNDQDNLIPSVVPMALSSEDAARALGVSPKTLANWRCAGRGPAYVHVSDSPRSPVLYLMGGFGELAALPPPLRGR